MSNPDQASAAFKRWASEHISGDEADWAHWATPAWDAARAPLLARIAELEAALVASTEAAAMAATVPYTQRIPLCDAHRIGLKTDRQYQFFVEDDCNLCTAWDAYSRGEGPQPQAPVADQPAEPSHIHRKSGGRYTLLGEGRLQCDTPLADMAEIAIYRGEDGRLWARDAVEFAGRFDPAAPKGDSNG